MTQKRHTPDQVMSGANGTKIITGAATDTFARGFQVNEDATISVLTSQSVNAATGDFEDAADVLENHIEGSGATTLKSGTIVMCRQHHFMDITPSSGSVNLIY